MAEFQARCGCELEATVRYYSCECCGSDYDIEDAEIVKECDFHNSSIINDSA